MRGCSADREKAGGWETPGVGWEEAAERTRPPDQRRALNKVMLQRAEATKSGQGASPPGDPGYACRETELINPAVKSHVQSHMHL